MNDNLGTLFFDGKVYNLKDLSIEKLKELENKLKEEEKKTKDEIEKIIESKTK